MKYHKIEIKNFVEVSAAIMQSKNHRQDQILRKRATICRFGKG